jgi:hypothetical protein
MDGLGGGSGTLEGDGRDLAAQLRMTLTALAAGVATRVELEAVACALVSNLREQNEELEQVLLRIKRILAEAGLRPGRGAAPDRELSPDAQLYRDVIGWCIEHYYRDGR